MWAWCPFGEVERLGVHCWAKWPESPVHCYPPYAVSLWWESSYRHRSHFGHHLKEICTEHCPVFFWLSPAAKKKKERKKKLDIHKFKSIGMSETEPIMSRNIHYTRHVCLDPWGRCDVKAHMKQILMRYDRIRFDCDAVQHWHNLI